MQAIVRPPWAQMNAPQKYDSIYRSNLGPLDNINKYQKIVQQEIRQDQNNTHLLRKTPPLMNQLRAYKGNNEMRSVSVEPGKKQQYIQEFYSKNMSRQRNPLDVSDIDGARAQQRQAAKVRNPLFTEDIQGSKPACQYFSTKRQVNPVDPQYPIPWGSYDQSSRKFIQQQLKKPSYQLSVIDIDGAQPKIQHLTKLEEKIINNEIKISPKAQSKAPLKDTKIDQKLTEQSIADYQLQNLTYDSAKQNSANQSEKTGKKFVRNYEPTDIFNQNPQAYKNLLQQSGDFQNKIGERDHKPQQQQVQKKVQQHKDIQSLQEKMFNQKFNKMLPIRDIGILKTTGRSVVTNDVDQFACQQLFRNNDITRQKISYPEI